ncbi:MAG: hypothetical protein ACRD5Z_00710, partial [Bryobacteraceae bacterium]
LNPAPQEMSDEAVAAEVAIEFPDVAQIGNQLWRNRLWPIHPLRVGRIELPLHDGGAATATLSS